MPRLCGTITVNPGMTPRAPGEGRQVFRIAPRPASDWITFWRPADIDVAPPPNDRIRFWLRHLRPDFRRGRH